MILFSDVSKIFARLSDHTEERIFLFDFQYGSAHSAADLWTVVLGRVARAHHIHDGPWILTLQISKLFDRVGPLLRGASF